MTRIPGFILLLALAGCVTPVIPLPPPSPERYEVALKDEQHVTLAGRPGTEPPGALVFSFNQQNGLGLITRVEADGSFQTEPLRARDGHRLELWLARGTDEVTSDVVCADVVLAEGRLRKQPCQ